MTRLASPMLEWIEGVRDPYEAQGRVQARIGERSPDQVGREVASALASAALGDELRALAVGLVVALSSDVSDDALAVERLVHVGPSEVEHPEAALAALARGVSRSPDDPHRRRAALR